MKLLRLTTPARERLREIVAYTIGTFGVDQAQQYHEQLIAGAEQLCNSPFPLGRPCPLLSDQKKSTELLYIQIGKHYLIYRETDEYIVVYDFVHVSRNLPAVISMLEGVDD